MIIVLFYLRVSTVEPHFRRGPSYPAALIIVEASE